MADVLGIQRYLQKDAYKPKAPTIILLAGFAGAGKTTLAKSLSRRLHLEILIVVNTRLPLKTYKRKVLQYINASRDDT